MRFNHEYDIGSECDFQIYPRALENHLRYWFCLFYNLPICCKQLGRVRKNLEKRLISNLTVVLVHDFVLVLKSNCSYWTARFTWVASHVGPFILEPLSEINWLIDWLIDWLTDWLTDDWLVDWLIKDTTSSYLKRLLQQHWPLLGQQLKQEKPQWTWWGFPVDWTVLAGVTRDLKNQQQLHLNRPQFGFNRVSQVVSSSFAFNSLLYLIRWKKTKR